MITLACDDPYTFLESVMGFQVLQNLLDFD